MSERAAFGQRLRRERERRGLTLDEIAAQSKVGASHFAALERGDLSRWPAGIFGIGFIRSYAQAVGLDPLKTVEEFSRVRSEPEARTAKTTATPADAVPISSPLDAAASVVETDSVTLRLSLESETGAALASPPRSPQRQIAAAAAEAAVLAALAGPVWWVRGATAFWMTLAIGALVWHLVTAAGGRPWLTRVVRRRSTPSPSIATPTASAPPRDKRRSPDTRPSPAFRRARRADRRRTQA